MTPEHELIRDSNASCCDWDCKQYPSTAKMCFNDEFKCVWYAIVAKVKEDKLKTKQDGLFKN